MKDQAVLVIGGLGFIGFHIVQSLVKKGARVKIASRRKEGYSEQNVPIIKFDLEKIDLNSLRSILQDFDFVIFAGGADDRQIPKGSADEFFYNGNVKPCIKLAAASSKTQIQKFLILGSYFSHFNRTRPEWQMEKHHPYVRSRVQQFEQSKIAADGKVKIVSLEIPYVFGSAPNLVPLWKPLINYIDKMPIVFYTKGGTNIIDVRQLANAAVGTLETKDDREHWIVGGENVTWVRLIQMISNALGKKRIVLSIPNFLLKFVALIVGFYFKMLMKSPGLKPYPFVRTQTAFTYLDTEESKSILDYSDSHMQKIIDETVVASGF